VPAGAFTTIASQTSAGLRWKLERARATEGGVCFRLTTTPALDLVQGDRQCYFAPDGSQPGFFVTEFPFTTGATNAYDIVIGSTFGRINNATFQFVDGSTATPAFLDKTNGVIVWAGATKPFVGSVKIDLESEIYGCGPGDIVNARQLAGRSEKDILDARRHPWTCSSEG
jgi:hypothetical protein